MSAGKTPPPDAPVREDAVAERPDPRARNAAKPPPPPEDESADPVGDGHSDAEWAARHPRAGR